MKLSEIKIIEKGPTKQIFIDDIEQKGVTSVETSVFPGEVTEVQISYVTDKFEIVREVQDEQSK